MNQSPWDNRKPKQSPVDDSEPLLTLEHLTCGRMLAWYAIQQHDETGLFLSDVLQDGDMAKPFSRQERGLAVDVSSGVLRRRRTLDTILESQISRPRNNVEPDLWRLLQLGVFQVVFSRTPDHAAVDTTVELARKAGCHRWTGFVNGVLRNVLRLLTDNRLESPAPDALPTSSHLYRQLAQPILPDPMTNMAEYVGCAFSLPRSLASRWHGRMSESELLSTCFHSLQPPTTCLRVNRLRASSADVQAALEEQGVDVEPGSSEWSLRVAHTSKLNQLAGFDEGLWSVQDESAMMASEMLAPQPGESILDLCSAPGGKTTHLAELMNDNGWIAACDVSEYRLGRVEESIERLQLQSIEPHLIKKDGALIPTGPFDAALVDVPCSNSGVLSRRPEARWRFQESDLEELTQLQTRLLLTAFDQLRVGGRMVYSTCSIEPEETTAVIDAVNQHLPGLTVIEQRTLLPGHPGDGAFQALMTKTQP